MRTVLGVKGVVTGIFCSGADAVEDAIAELAQERRSPREPYRKNTPVSGIRFSVDTFPRESYSSAATNTSRAVSGPAPPTLGWETAHGKTPRSGDP
jgi:hypothetical protein